MEHIDDECHRFERHNRTQHHQQHKHYQPQQHTCSTGHNIHHTHSPSVVDQPPLDTVHTLHQTIVHLRNALDAANHEIGTLKKQITINDDIELGKQYRDEAHRPHHQHYRLHHHHCTDQSTICDQIDDSAIQSEEQSNIPQNHIKPIDEHKVAASDLLGSQRFDGAKQPLSSENHEESSHSGRTHETKSKTTVIDSSDTVSARYKMASKIDVKIKLTSNFQVDGNESSTDVTTDTTSGEMIGIHTVLKCV